MPTMVVPGAAWAAPGAVAVRACEDVAAVAGGVEGRLRR